MLSPDSVFPTNVGGALSTPAQVFATTELNEEEFQSTKFLAFRLQGLQEVFGMVPFARPETDAEGLGYLTIWAEQLDRWHAENGDKLPFPILPRDDFDTAVFVDNRSPDHVDAPHNMPVGLSIGLQGERELSGLILPDIGTCMDVINELHGKGEMLRDRTTINGFVVEKVLQKPGTVVHIAAHNTVHSGIPISEDPVNAAIAIGYGGVTPKEYEEVVLRYINTFYTSGVMGDLQNRQPKLFNRR